MQPAAVCRWLLNEMCLGVSLAVTLEPGALQQDDDEEESTAHHRLPVDRQAEATHVNKVEQIEDQAQQQYTDQAY